MQWDEKADDYLYNENFIKGFAGENRWLSNFWPAAVVYKGRKYLNSEAAYQAAKTLDIEDRKRFESMEAGRAKREGRKVTMRADWDEVKLTVMKEILLDKFMRNEDLRDKLVATGDKYLEETNWWGDTYWGVCKSVGQNMLGKILMEIRYELSSVKL